MQDDDSTQSSASNDNETFARRVEQFIELANHFAEQDGLDMIASSLLFAAARFGAFNAARKYNDADTLAQDGEEAAKYFADIYRKMYKQNTDEYVDNFDEYFSTPKTH